MKDTSLSKLIDFCKSNNPKSFTDFRAKINENILPHSIDHIVFFQKGKRSK